MNRYYAAVIIIVTWFHSLMSAPWFGYDRGVHAAQKGDWKKSTQLLTQKLIDEPDRVDLLYDAGVASFRSGEIDKAHAYFMRAAESEKVDSGLKEQVYFNLGNCCVEQKQLKEAVYAYEKALEINPDNDRLRPDLIQKLLKLIELAFTQ